MLRAKLGGYIFEPLEAIQVILDCLGQFGPFWATVVVTLVHSGPKIWSANIVLKILLAIASCNFLETPCMLNKLRQLRH